MPFKDIKGQDKPIEILKSYFKNPSLSAAYLFTGQEGVGKFLAAKNFAKALNCLNEGEDACGVCPSCLKIDKGLHPDVHFIAPEDTDIIRIEDIRNLKKDVFLKPYEAKKRVFIINDAHTLNAEAANALLKVLEEPPPHNLIILVTPKPGLLFKTVVSRCRIIKFAPLKRENLKNILFKDYSLHNHLAHFLAYFSEGRIGAALRLKDTDILSRKNKIIDGFIGLNKQGLENTIVEGRQNLRDCLNILAAWFRDLYLLKTGLGHCELINLDRKSELLVSAGRYNFSELDKILENISDALFYTGHNINAKLLLSNLRMQVLWKR